MLGFDIVDGVGTLRKQQFKNPYWRGVTTIGTVLGSINTDVMDVIVKNCKDNIQTGEPLDKSTLFDKTEDFENTLIGIPTTLSHTEMHRIRRTLLKAC
jgi:hypothetical protein